MKKLLLSLCALFAAISMNAQYNVGDYIFTATAKYKVTKILEVTQPGAEWNNFSSEIFSPYTAETEEDFDGIKSTRSDEGDYISYAVPLEYGSNYIVTMKFLATADGSTSITSGAQNQIDAWVGAYDHAGVKAGVANIDYQQVASTATVKANEWTEISWAFLDTLAVNAELEEPGGFLNILFSRINTDCVIATNMQVVQVQEVYDTRISDRMIAYAKLLMNDENFNTEAAADAKAELEGAIELTEQLTLEGGLDDMGEAQETINALSDILEDYLNVESKDMKDYLQYIDITSFGAYGRGRVNADRGCFRALGGNWGHSSAWDYLMSAIQNGYKDHNATLTIFNTDFPAGKYFFTAEMRNANTAKDSWPCTLSFNLTTYGTTISVGDNTIEVDTLSGEQFQKFYVVGDVVENGKFEAKVYWPGQANGVNGGAFQVRALQVRAFGEVEQQIHRNQAWKAFIAQWNAAVSARTSLASKADDPNYPWANDTIQTTLDKWDPYYNAVIAAGWVGEDGSDTGVATIEELEDWALYQGYDEIVVDEEGNESRVQYAVVRGYQYANNYVQAENQVIFDTKAAIEEAKKTNDDAMNIEGDHETYLAVINQVQTTLDEILANTTDERAETDKQNLTDAIAMLNDATVAFKESAILTPLVDIDFSGSFQTTVDPEDESIITSYYIDGKTESYPNGSGRMVFPTVTSVEPDLANDGHYWQLGFGDVLLDVLHVGSSAAYVYLDEEDRATDEDVNRVEFDLWLGNLSKGYMTVELQNKDGVRLGGFSIDRYNGAVNFNTFNNQTGAPNDLTSSSASGGDGMDIRAKATGLGSQSVGNAGICVDANKSTFTLIFDYKARAMKGKIDNAKNGISDGAEMPMLDINDATITDNKVAQLMITSNYASANSGAQSRRCWFDNLKIYKYKSTAEGPHFEPKASLKGDVNEDGAVNINDVVAIINVMAGTAEWPNANVNEDPEGSVDINDVVAVINIMAGK